MAGNTRMLAAAGGVVIFAAGIGVGYALHGDGKQTAAAKPVAAVTSAASSVASSSAPADFSLDGKLTLAQGAFEWDHGADGSTPCIGYQGYSDITAGAPVVITDQGGTVIATGQLDQGSATVGANGRGTACTFTFTVQHVPVKPFYGVTVSHRGAVTYSSDQAQRGDVSLSLG